MKYLLSLVTLIAFGSGSANAEDENAAKHLFILSGQSNMAGLDPKISFIPAVEQAYGKDHVIVVKSAQGGQPIRRWYKDWKSAAGDKPESTGDLYDVLMKKVGEAIEGQKIESITLVWMQGERDAREQHADVYAESLDGLVAQVSKDLGHENVNFVIGRLSDFDNENKRYKHWTKIRDVQVKLAEDNPRYAWVDTDDLNDGLNRQGKEIKNDLHYSADGYKELGKRFAEKAIELIEQE